MVQIDIPDTSYSYDELQKPSFQKLSDQVRSMRTHGSLSPAVLHRIRKYFRIKNIYHSNAIEGNILEVGETRKAEMLFLIASL